ncbi:hypothetical protein D3C80_1784390 [compost metagenome]
MFDPHHALAHHLLPTFNLAVRRLRRLGGLLRITRDVMHGGGHLVHGRRHLVGLFLLAADFEVGLFGHGGQGLR